MTVTEIMNIANLQCDETLEAHTLLAYFNQGVGRLNLDCNLKLPRVKPNEIINQYEISEDEFINEAVADILINYISYSIYDSAGYPLNENNYLSKWQALENQFKSKFNHLIKDEYRLNTFENGSVKQRRTLNTVPFMRNRRMW